MPTNFLKILVLLAAWAAPGMLPAQGLVFQTGDWKTMLSKARAEDKLVFVDVYTTWCGPCKEMDRKVFPDQAVGAFFNTAFINYKLDAEKGEGPGISDNYHVGAFPTYLFVNGNGELIHKSVGLSQAAEFLAIGQTALRQKEAHKPFSWYESAYQAGNRDPEFVRTYLLNGALEGKNMDQELNAYLAALSEDQRFTDTTLLLAGNVVFDCEGQAYALLLEASKNRVFYFKTSDLTRRAIRSGIQRAQNHSLRKAIKNQNPVLLDTILASESKGSLLYQYHHRKTYLTYYRETGNLEGFWEIAEPLATALMAKDPAKLATLDTIRHQAMLTNLRAMKQDTNSMLFQEAKAHTRPETSSAASDLAEYAAGAINLGVEGQKLEQAARWAARSAELFPEYSYTLGVHGKALLRLGQTDRAREMLQKAMELAETEKEAESWRKELEKIH